MENLTFVALQEPRLSEDEGDKSDDDAMEITEPGQGYDDYDSQRTETEDFSDIPTDVTYASDEEEEEEEEEEEDEEEGINLTEHIVFPEDVTAAQVVAQIDDACYTYLETQRCFNKEGFLEGEWCNPNAWPVCSKGGRRAVLHDHAPPALATTP